MQKIDYEEMARRLIINGAEAYRKKFILEVDILSGYDRQKNTRRNGQTDRRNKA